jgi:hypothetical protein
MCEGFAHLCLQSNCRNGGGSTAEQSVTDARWERQTAEGQLARIHTHMQIAALGSHLCPIRGFRCGARGVPRALEIQKIQAVAWDGGWRSAGRSLPKPHRGTLLHCASTFVSHCIFCAPAPLFAVLSLRPCCAVLFQRASQCRPSGWQNSTLLPLPFCPASHADAQARKTHEAHRQGRKNGERALHKGAHAVVWSPGASGRQAPPCRGRAFLKRERGSFERVGTRILLRSV